MGGDARVSSLTRLASSLLRISKDVIMLARYGEPYNSMLFANNPIICVPILYCNLVIFYRPFTNTIVGVGIERHTLIGPWGYLDKRHFLL